VGASFCVYLIPLVGPHASWFVGEALFPEAHRSPLWMLTNFAVVLFVQTLVAGYFYWLFGKPGWRAISLLVAFPLVFLTLQRVYLVTIPAMFLEEPDTAAEKASWPSVCSAHGTGQTDLRTASELWVRFHAPPNNYAVLTMPGCRLANVTLPQPTYVPSSGVDFMIEPISVISGGRAIVQRYEKAHQSWWLIPGTPPEGDSSLLRLEEPADHAGNSGPPILSTDGRWVAWVATIPGTGPRVLYHVLLRPRDPKDEGMIVDLSALGPDFYLLRKLDMQAREIRLWKRDHLVIVGFDGTLKEEFIPPATVLPQENTYLEMGQYWLAWDAAREDGPYRIEWSLPSGSGSHRVPLGRTINSVAFDTAGKWIAVSVSSDLMIGKTRDAVYVLSAAHGEEVFRKYLPPFNRSSVAFLDGGFLAYSDLDGVHVLRVPE
jgi:hypothetical protein